MIVSDRRVSSVPLHNSPLETSPDKKQGLFKQRLESRHTVPRYTQHDTNKNEYPTYENYGYHL